MAIKITSDCISCNACLPACPNMAIYPPRTEWSLAEGTHITGAYRLMNGTVTEAETMHAPLSKLDYYIVPDKCTECQGFHEEPQCAYECPMDCCVPDELYQETVEELMSKKDRLHI